MQVTYKIHILEDNYRYLEVDTITDNGIEYLLLSQETNPSNICLRKIVTNEDNYQYYGKLQTKEFHEMFQKFIEKNKNLFE